MLILIFKYIFPIQLFYIKEENLFNNLHIYWYVLNKRQNGYELIYNSVLYKVHDNNSYFILMTWIFSVFPQLRHITSHIYTPLLKIPRLIIETGSFNYYSVTLGIFYLRIIVVFVFCRYYLERELVFTLFALRLSFIVLHFFRLKMKHSLKFE